VPATVYDLGSVLLTLLEDHHRLVLWNVDRVYVTAGFHAEARSGASGRYIANSRYIDVFASVELEGRLGRVNFEVDLRLWVVERCKLLQRRRTSVDGNAARVGIGNKAVVDVWLFLAQGESLFGTDTRIFFDWASGNASIIYDLVLVCDEVDFCSGDGRSWRQVEVATLFLARRL
jgi:hypothetical protein